MLGPSVCGIPSENFLMRTALCRPCNYSSRIDGGHSQKKACRRVKRRMQQVAFAQHSEVFVDKCRKGGETPAEPYRKKQPRLRAGQASSFGQSVQYADEKASRYVDEQRPPRKRGAAPRAQGTSDKVTRSASYEAAGSYEKQIFQHVDRNCAGPACGAGKVRSFVSLV